MTNCIHFGVRLHVLLRLVCIALVLGSPTISVAQTPLSLSDVLSDALRNSSDVARLDRDLALRLADAIETETRTNPEVEVMARYSDKGEGAGLELEFSQPLRFSDFTQSKNRPGLEFVPA